MLKHHKESLQIMKEHFQRDNDVIALILGGSVAKGEARPDSDLDGIVIVTDEAYEKRKTDGAIADCITNMCTYPGGYFDIKYFNKGYLQLAVKQGSDPTRNSFAGAVIVFSSDPEIEQIIKQIPIYPKHEKLERIKLFHSILRLSGGYFFNMAISNNDQYMLDKCCFEIVYAGLRMLYVHNEIFFPCHLRLLEYTNRLTNKPENIITLAEAVNKNKDTISKDAFINEILNFTDWEIDSKQHGSAYVEKMEQTWQYSNHNPYEL